MPEGPLERAIARVTGRPVEPLRLGVAARLAPRRLRPADAFVLPDYILIGAQKSGSTSLDMNLARHPNTRPSLAQEVHFFDRFWPKGLGWYRRHFPTRREAEEVLRATGSPLVAGESTPYYMFHPLAPRRVHQTIPEVKLIAVLRDPVTRAYSHYHHERRRFSETATPEQAFDPEFERSRIEAEERRLIEQRGPAVSYAHRHYSVLARGRYAEQLERWLEFFPREQLLVICAEEFFATPARELSRVASFLNLPDWDPGDVPRYNANRYEQMPDDVRARLTDYYREHNRRLEQLLDRTFPWMS